MAKFAKHLNSFVAGELSPRMYGRTDSDQYGQGCQELLNKIVRPQGGAFRRPGSVFINDGWYDTSQTKQSDFDTDIRQIPFRFSRTEGAVVVLNTGSNGLNSIGVSIYEPTLKQWLEPVLSLSTGYAAFAGWTTQAELDEVQFAQSGDVLVLVSSKNPPIFILRTDALTYTIKDIYSLRDVFPLESNKITYAGANLAIQEKLSPTAAPDNSPWYNVPYRLALGLGSMSASATTGVVTLTMSNKLGAYGLVGTILRITKAGVTGFARVDSISNFDITATVLKALGGTGGQDSWEYQDFGPHLTLAEDAWPRTVCFHDQRLWYGNTKLKPNTFWASQVGDFTEMMIVRGADDAQFASLSADRPFSYTLASNQIDDIQWMVSGQRSIFIGTAGGEWIGESSGDTILGPLNPNFSPETSYGSKLLQAVNSNGSIIFADQSAQRLREFIYNRNEDAYRAVNLSYFAEHMIKKGLEIYDEYEFPEIKQLSVQQGENNLIWVIDSNGMLHTFQKEREYGTLAWSTIQFGGDWNADGHPPKVLSVCCVPNGISNDDDVYVFVQRYINGTSKIYFEKIGTEFLGPSLNDTDVSIERQPVYSDSCQMIHNLTGPKFFSRFPTTIDAEYFTTSATGTGTGSPTASNGLVLHGGTVKYVSYNPANAALVQTGTIIIEVTPNYSGLPASTQTFFCISKSNSDDDNLIILQHDGSTQDLNCLMKDATGGETIFLNLENWDPIAGQKYQIVISFDCNAGKYGMWINGVFIARDGSGPMTRDTNIGQFVVGTNHTLADSSDFTVNKLALATEYWGGDQISRFKPAFALSTYVMGVDHLYGDNEILADGQHLDPMDLRTGELEIELTNCALVGMQYTSRLISMDIEAGSILGSAQGEMKKVHELTVRFERTVGAQFGYDLDHLDDINFIPEEFTSGTPIPLFTGDKTYKFPATYRRNLTIVVQQTQPMPCTVTSIIARGLTYD